MAVERISRTFKDISLSFEPHPVTKDLQILKNESAIKRSVRNIIETIPSEKFFNPNFGSRVNELLFDFVDVGSALLIEEEIKTALKTYEERIENVKVYVTPSPNENTFEIAIQYDIIGQDFPQQQFRFILESTR
jgi:phage baseplate assembly protein W